MFGVWGAASSSSLCFDTLSSSTKLCNTCNLLLHRYSPSPHQSTPASSHQSSPRVYPSLLLGKQPRTLFCCWRDSVASPLSTLQQARPAINQPLLASTQCVYDRFSELSCDDLVHGILTSWYLTKMLSEAQISLFVVTAALTLDRRNHRHVL